MKLPLLFLAVLCFATRAATAQEVTLRMIDNASKSITLGERMSPETVWKRFGISPLYSHDDTELLNGFVEVYKTGEIGRAHV